LIILMLISNLMMGVRGVVVKPAGTWAGIGTPNKKKTKTKKGISLQTSVYLHHLQDARCISCAEAEAYAML
jgi:hypothetical protein